MCEIMKCPACKGLGYLEFEHGLIRISCSYCKGTGEIRRELSEETEQKIKESMKGNENRKNGKHNRSSE